MSLAPEILLQKIELSLYFHGLFEASMQLMKCATAIFFLLRRIEITIETRVGKRTGKNKKHHAPSKDVNANRRMSKVIGARQGSL